jgi:hypothetical protein
VKLNDSIRAFSDDLIAILDPNRVCADKSVLSTDDGFNRLALRLFHLQSQHNPVYWRWCKARGLQFEEIEHWSQIPAMPTAGFREMPMTCIQESERLHCFCSSGTTGQIASRHYHHHDSLRLYESSLVPPFWRHLMVPQESRVEPSHKHDQSFCPLLIILTPSRVQAPSSSLVYMLETIRHKLGVQHSCITGFVDKSGGWSLDLKATKTCLTQAQETDRPVLILGTAFGFVHLLDHLTATSQSTKLPTGSRVLETGGYKGLAREIPKSELHIAISSSLGVPLENIVSEYGMCELSSQAYDHIAGAALADFSASEESQRSFLFPPWAQIRIISPETGLEISEGESGLIQIVDLANAWSVLAIQTEDVGIRTAQGFRLVGRANQADQRGCSLMQKWTSHELFA